MAGAVASIPARGSIADATAIVAGSDAMDRSAGRLLGAQRRRRTRRKSAVARPAPTARDGHRLPVGKSSCSWRTKFRRMIRAEPGNESMYYALRTILGNL